MKLISREPYRIRLNTRYLGEFGRMDERLPVAEFAVKLQEQVDAIVDRYKVLGLDPNDVTMLEEVDCGMLTYNVYASLMETQEQFDARMKQVREIDEREAEELRRKGLHGEMLREAEELRKQAIAIRDAKLAEERELVAKLLVDPEFEDYERLYEKFKLYESHRKQGLLK